MHGSLHDAWAHVRSNLLLRSLNVSDATLMTPHLERRRLRRGEVLTQAGVPITTVFFPETVTASILERHVRADLVGIGVIGREGMVGWSALLGCTTTRQRNVVLMADGDALAISVERLRLICSISPSLTASLLRYVQAIMAQLGGTIVSNQCDSAERRLVRWLLMLHDRQGEDDLSITHQGLACLVNLRRASVTECLHVLEGEHLLHCRRGHVTIHDRDGLETLAGDAYGSSEQLYRATIGPFGTRLRP
jgi:CRP-like cAMP-binding protein